jgi:hypothetical protein
MANGDRYFRQTTASVLKLYIEFEDGILPGDHTQGARFEPRVIDYRIDIERILNRELTKQEQLVLFAVHRDGLTHSDAIRYARLEMPVNPYAFVSSLEIRLGKSLEKKKMLDLLAYLR